MLLKIIKLPVKLILIPVIFALMALHFVCSILLGVSSILTGLLSSLFLFGAVAEWINHAPSAMIWQAVGIGLFLAAAPHLVEWLLGKLTDMTTRLMGFVFS